MKRSLRSWLWRVPLDQEFDEEISLHIEMRTRELIDHGMHTDQRIDQILEHLKRLGADCEDARKRDAFNANVLNKMVD